MPFYVNGKVIDPRPHFIPSVSRRAAAAVPAAPDIEAPDGLIEGETIVWSAVPTATSYHLYRDGVLVGAVTSPYTILSADVGPAITVTAVNAAGESAPSNSLVAFSPLDVPTLIEWLDTDAVPNGALTSFVCRKGVATATAASGTITKSASAFTDMTGDTWPGLSLAGVMAVTGLGATLDPLSSLLVIVSVQDAVGSTTASIIMEYTANAGSTNGGFWIVTNDTGEPADTVEFHLQGGGGSGTWNSLINTAPLSDPGVIAVRFDFAQPTGSDVRELDGFALSGAAFSSACAADTFANSTLYVGARTGGVAPWTGGCIRDIAFLTGATTAADRLAITRFFASRVGAPSA